MKRIIPITLSVLAVSTGVIAQTTAEIIERALAAAPRQMHDGATVIKWNAENTYETLKKGANRLVCYDRVEKPPPLLPQARLLAAAGPPSMR